MLYEDSCCHSNVYKFISSVYLMNAFYKPNCRIGKIKTIQLFPFTEAKLTYCFIPVTKRLLGHCRIIFPFVLLLNIMLMFTAYHICKLNLAHGSLYLVLVYRVYYVSRCISIQRGPCICSTEDFYSSH